MGTNVNLTDVLKKIALNTDFISGAAEKFGSGEKLEFLFISKSEDKADTVVLRDTSGDSYSISAQNLQGYLTDEEYNALIAENENKKAEKEKEVLANTQARLNNVGALNQVGKVEFIQETNSPEKLKGEIDSLKQQKTSNLSTMTYLKTQIEMLQTKIEKAIEDAVNSMEEATEEQEKKANEIVENKIKEFQAKKERGENVSPDSVASQVKSEVAALGTPQGFSNAVSQLLFANTNYTLMNSLTDQLSDKVSLDKELDKQIEAKTTRLSELTAQDVMGFTMNSVDANGDGKSGNVQFDMFFDKDNDNLINSSSDFVGATGQKSAASGWSQLSSLDGNGGEKDGKITSDELSQAGIKFAVTDETGKQSAMDVSKFEELFDKIEISTQQSNSAGNASNSPRNFNSDKINKFMGAFTVKVGDNSVSGYQTRNTQDWLQDNYSGVMSQKGVKDVGVESSKNSDPTQNAETYEEFVQEYKDTGLPELKEKIENAQDKLSLSQDTVDSLKELAESSAEAEAQNIENNIESPKEESEENANKISESDLNNEEKEYIKNAGLKIEEMTFDDLKVIQDKIKQESQN